MFIYEKLKFGVVVKSINFDLFQQLIKSYSKMAQMECQLIGLGAWKCNIDLTSNILDQMLTQYEECPPLVEHSHDTQIDGVDDLVWTNGRKFSDGQKVGLRSGAADQTIMWLWSTPQAKDAFLDGEGYYYILASGKVVNESTLRCEKECIQGLLQECKDRLKIYQLIFFNRLLDDQFCESEGLPKRLEGVIVTFDNETQTHFPTWAEWETARPKLRCVKTYERVKTKHEIKDIISSLRNEVAVLQSELAKL